MKIADFKLGKLRRAERKWRRRVQQAILLDLDDSIVAYAQRIQHKYHQDARRLMFRSRLITSVQFNLNALSERECVENFRFKKRDVGRISEMVGWVGVSERNQYRCDPVVATCFVLHKLGTTVRWADIELTYGKHRSQMSEIMWEIVELFNEKYGYALELRGSFLKQRAGEYAKAIEEAGSPLEKCVGFIDCTRIRMCRPGGNNAVQRSVYSGHKRVHCLIYQSLTTPDGLMFSLFGPLEGRRHDMTLLRQSGWNEVLRDNLHIDGEWFYIYGDSAYLLRLWMQRPFTRGTCSAEEGTVNTRMSEARVSVEHNYKDVKQLWSSQDFARKIKVRLAPVGLLYRMSALLTNFRVCLYQSGQIGTFFNCCPPTLEEYLEG